MDLLTAITTYFLLWWLVFIPTLSWRYEKQENPKKGFASSAPQNPRLKEKVILTSVITAAILLITHLVVCYTNFDWIAFLYGDS